MKSTLLLAIPSLVVLTGSCLAPAAWGQTQTASPANLAILASPSASYVSGDTKLAALNDGFNPTDSRDNERGSYGNWNRTGTQWVQYEWSRPISTAKMDVYWWADGRGIALPKACRLSYWNGTTFAPAQSISGLGVAGNQFNTSSFEEVSTSKLRLEIDSDGGFSTGILEWLVYDSGKSPRLAPVVSAGVDRVVIQGGKTYLNGSLKTLDPTAAPVWTKASGPGMVTFEQPRALSTAAKFSQVGEYCLRLSVGDGDLRSADELKVRVVAPPPPEQLDAVYTRSFKINSPLWNHRVKALIVNWIPHCIEMISRTNLTEGQGGIDNFVEAAKALAGQPHAKHKGYVFANAWVHQTVESMSIALMLDAQGDPEIIAAQNQMRSTLDDWIPKILAAQEPDGYLQTAYTLGDPAHWPGHWSPEGRGNHEGYTAGYFIESAINHYMMTDRKDARLFNAARKLADCWCANLGPAPKQEWFDGHQEMEQALVRFGRFVNDLEGRGKGQKYIELAKFLLDCRKGGDEYDQSHLPVVQQYEAVGHAVRAVYTYSGMADVAVETHNIDYQSAVMSLWDNLVNKKYYITGGVGSGETSEGFGPNYSLRNQAYCESCSSCGMIFFQYKMNLAYQDAKYADLYEETLYNALLGSIDLGGKTFYYDNPLVGGRRTSWHVCPCCVGNIPRTLLMLPTWMYARGSNNLFVNLFIGSTATVENIAGVDVQVIQVTDYPWNGKVSLTLNPSSPKEFALHLRVPNRQTSELYSNNPEVSGLLALTLNGSKVEPRIENGYAVFRRRWQAGDRIDLEVPLQVQRVKASEKIEADRGRLALRYGPLVYNAESVDQPDVNRPVDAKAPFQTEWKSDLLGGVTVIKGKFADGGVLTAIPNFARNNRNEADAATTGGNPGINYAGGAATATNSGTITNATTAQAGRRERNQRLSTSIVWLKQQP